MTGLRALILAAALAVALLLPLLALAQGLPPNELGRVMVLEYHRIDVPEGRWTRTPENFRHDLETFYARGYRLQALNDLLDGRIITPAGTTPLVLTFDDSSPGQFRYIERNGTLEIDPQCAVGILDAFTREHPDFGRAATFYVLPAADPPNRLFNQKGLEAQKLRYLLSRGYEIGNHTLWHANLGKYPEQTVRKQLAEAQRWIQQFAPEVRIRTLALPHGVYPRNLGWALQGTVKDVSYRHDAILMVSGGAAPSPFSATFDPTRVPRIQALDSDLGHWLSWFDRHPGERFVSDGDPRTLTIPAAERSRLRRTLRADLRVIER